MFYLFICALSIFYAPSGTWTLDPKIESHALPARYPIHSSADEYLGCFHLWVHANNAARNIVVQIIFKSLLIPRSGIAGTYVCGTTKLFSTVAATLYIHSYQTCTRAPFSSRPHQTFCLCNNYPNGCGVVAYSGFHFHVPNDWGCWASFHMLIGHLCTFPAEVCI